MLKVKNNCNNYTGIFKTIHKIIDGIGLRSLFVSSIRQVYQDKPAVLMEITRNY